MMKILTFKGQFRGNVLMDELLEAFPEWMEKVAEDEWICRLSVYSTPDEVYLHVPDDADEKKIEAVVKAHNPIAPSKSEKAEKTKMERRAELQTKIAKVKDEKLTLPEIREIVAALAELLGVFDA